MVYIDGDAESHSYAVKVFIDFLWEIIVTDVSLRGVAIKNVIRGLNPYYVNFY